MRDYLLIFNIHFILFFRALIYYDQLETKQKRFVYNFFNVLMLRTVKDKKR